MLKKGYIIEVDSWENDGYNYQTNTISGLTDNDVNFYKELLLLFYSKSNNHNCFGNCYEKSDLRDIEETLEILTNLIIKYYPNFNKFYNDCDVSDSIYTIKYEFLNKVLGSGEYYFRVFDNMKIYYIPEDIIEIETIWG